MIVSVALPEDVPEVSLGEARVASLLHPPAREREFALRREKITRVRVDNDKSER